MTTDIKHQQVFDLLQEGMPAYKAYQQVYKCSEASAKSNAYKIFDMENNGMRQALEDVGLDSYTLASRLKDTIEDKATRKDGLNLAFKIKGSFSPEKKEATVKIVNHKQLLDELDND